MKKIQKFEGALFTLVMTLLAVVTGGMGGVMMASVTTSATPDNTGTAGPAASAGQDLAGTQMPGQATTVSDVGDATGGVGGDGLIQPDIDDEITKIATDEVVLNTIKHRCKRKVKVNAFEVDHYMVDEPKFETTALKGSGTKAIDASSQLGSAVLNVTDKIFYVGQVITFPGVKGYAKESYDVYNSTSHTVYEDELCAIVVGLDSSKNPVIRPINGQHETQGGTDTYFPDIEIGQKVVGLDSAAYETQKFIAPSTVVPVPKRMYLQKRLVNSVVSDYFDAQRKRIPFAKATIAEAVLRKWRLENCRGDWRGKAAKFYTTPNDPTMGDQLTYTAEGLRWQFKREYTLAGNLTMADLIALCKFKFTGYDCSKTALWLVGRDLLADIQSLDMTLHKDISIVGSEVYGLKCSKLVTIFGDINIIHDPTLDKLGWSHCGGLIDEKGLVRYYMKNEQQSNERVHGEEAQREIVMTIDCLALKGFSHVWVDGSGIESVNSAIKVKPAASLADLTAASIGDICILTADINDVPTGAASDEDMSAGQVIIKGDDGYWDPYTGDVYASVG